jgi:hypothetical protein
MTTQADEKSEKEARAAAEQIIRQLQEQASQQPELPLSLQGRPLSVSAQASSRVQTRDMQSLNDSELKSVYALLAYVAHNENIPQETVQAIVEANFGVNHVARLQHKDYDEVIRFLVDLRIDEMSN